MLSNRFNSFLDCIDHWADETPESPAWWVSNGDLPLCVITWSQFRLQLLATISQLSSLEIPSKSRIVTCDRNCLEWVMVDLACQALHCIHVPVDVRLADSVKRDICKRVNPSLIVLLENPQAFSFLDTTRYRLLSKLDQIVDNSTRSYERVALSRVSTSNPASVATILFTSGSTSSPKGVQLSLENLISNALQKLDAMPQYPTDRRLNLLPFAHAYARTCELSTWLLSGSSLLATQSMDNAILVAPHFQPTLFNGVPYVFESLRQRILSSRSTEIVPVQSKSNESYRQLLCQLLGTQLRMIAAGGAGLNEDTHHWFAKCGLPIYQGYGLTEAGPVVCSNRYPNAFANHVGWPVRETMIRIDENQRLYAKGPGVMVGYFADSPATQSKMVDGWLDTGDLAEWTSEGAVRILGRCDDRIVLATGYKLDPGPLEQEIAKALGIRYCAISSTDRRQLLVILPILKAGTADTSILHRKLLKVLSDQPSYVVSMKLMIVEDDWNKESGMLNAKGSLQRSRIDARYLGGSR